MNSFKVVEAASSIPMELYPTRGSHLKNINIYGFYFYFFNPTFLLAFHIQNQCCEDTIRLIKAQISKTISL